MVPFQGSGFWHCGELCELCELCARLESLIPPLHSGRARLGPAKGDGKIFV